MKCPVCKDVTLLMSEKNGIEIDYCPECRGIWLDRGELDKIVERAKAEEAGYHHDRERHGDRDYYREREYYGGKTAKHHKKKKGAMFSELLELFGGEGEE